MSLNKIMKNKLIIVEGPQGTGKTTLTNYLREKLSSSNLYRLSGQKDKSKKGKKYSYEMYSALLDYLSKMQEIPMDLIFDRTFFTEEIYARLDYKDYSFSDIYEELLKKFNQLNYDKYLLILYLKNTELYRKRLERDFHHNYQTFSIENSENQQQAYMILGEEIMQNKENTVKVIYLPMDNFEQAYNQIDHLFGGEDS